MYEIALAKAIELGPRRMSIGTSAYAVYGLRKCELRKLFVECGYSPRRRTWITCIQDWEPIFDVIVPREITDPNSTQCMIVFRDFNKECRTALTDFANKEEIPSFPKAVA